MLYKVAKVKSSRSSNKSTKSKFFLIFIVIGLVALVLAGAGGYWVYNYYNTKKINERVNISPKYITITKGDSINYEDGESEPNIYSPVLDATIMLDTTKPIKNIEVYDVKVYDKDNKKSNGVIYVTGSIFDLPLICFEDGCTQDGKSVTKNVTSINATATEPTYDGSRDMMIWPETFRVAIARRKSILEKDLAQELTMKVELGIKINFQDGKTYKHKFTADINGDLAVRSDPMEYIVELK